MIINNTFTGLFPGPVIILLCLIFVGCSGERPKNEEQEKFTIDINEEVNEEPVRVKQIFYALPSPLETAMLLKSSGAVFIEEYLNPVENVSDYLTIRSMAVNLGIYTTDLSYASLFDQTQICIKYMAVAKRLADNLGILDAVDNSTLERLEDNINNREVILDIVSENFMNSSSFLQENNREPVAAMLLTGGWLEGLYLAVSLADENNLTDNRLASRIIDKKLSLELVMLLLRENSSNDDVAYLIVEMEKIESIFRQMEIQSSSIAIDEDHQESVTLLRSSTTNNMDSKIFKQLKSTVTTIRNSFVS